MLEMRLITEAGFCSTLSPPAANPWFPLDTHFCKKPRKRQRLDCSEFVLCSAGFYEEPGFTVGEFSFLVLVFCLDVLVSFKPLLCGHFPFKCERKKETCGTYFFV
jgi:hypothetical protein